MSNEPKRKSRFHPDAAPPAGAPEGAEASGEVNYRGHTLKLKEMFDHQFKWHAYNASDERVAGGGDLEEVKGLVDMLLRTPATMSRALGGSAEAAGDAPQQGGALPTCDRCGIEMKLHHVNVYVPRSAMYNGAVVYQCPNCKTFLEWRDGKDPYTLLQAENAALRARVEALEAAIEEALSHLSHYTHGGAQYNPDLLTADSILRAAARTGDSEGSE